MATPGGASPGGGSDAAPGVVGRQAELDAICGLLDELAAGHGRAVVLEGEPGIGKTALLQAVLRRARAAGLTVRAAACDERVHRDPLAVLFDALEPGPEPEPGPESDPAATAPTASPAPSSATASSTAPFTASARWGAVLAGADPVAAAAERVLALVDRLCAAGPLLLAIDDLHAADEASLLVWQRLCAVAGQSPLLLLGTCRPVPRRAEIGRVRRILRDHGGVPIAVDRLGPDHAAELVGRLLGGAPGPRLSGRLEEAAGNPLYLRELTDSLVRTHAVTVHAGSAELVDGAPAARSAADTPPDGLAAVLADRLGFLGEPALELLRTAALLGPEFAVTDLSRVLGRPAGALVAAIQEAVDGGVLDPSGPLLRFRHGLLRQALHESVPEPERAALRRSAARALAQDGSPVERVAELILGDLAAAGGWEIGWAAEHAEQLGRRAPALAADLLAHALNHPAAGPGERAALRRELAAVCFLLARNEQALRLCEEILATESDPDSRSRAAWIRAYALSRLGRLPEAAAQVAAVSAEPGISELWLARLSAADALATLAGGRPAEAGRTAALALAAGERLADPMTVGYALHAESTLRFRAADMAGCVELVDRALSVAAAGVRTGGGAGGEDVQLTGLRLTLLAKRACALTELDRFAEADEAVRAVRALSERPGSPRPVRCAVPAAESAFHRGAWDEALAELADVRATVDDVSRPGDPATAAGISALIYLRCGGERAAAPLFAALPDPGVSARSCVRLPEAGGSGYALLARALLAERGGDPDLAATGLRVILEPGYAGAARRAMLLPALVRLALAADDPRLAAAARDAARAEAPQLPRAAAAARWCDGLLEQDPDQLTEVTGYLRRVGRLAELAPALEDAAVLLARTGRTEQARQAAAEALAVCGRIGADADARHIAQRLRAHGVRAQGRLARPSTGWAALTATERRVAELVGEGKSNPDIAAELRLSRRTVETHVSHILAKLGARSRREIVAGRSGIQAGDT
jgi:DNA-binding CsgD family transcriptional regulator